MGKIRLGIVLGGRSGEHSVSVASGMNVAGAADTAKYEVVLVGITRGGRWILLPGPEAIENASEPGRAAMREDMGQPVAAVPGARSFVIIGDAAGRTVGMDVVFPVLHGPFGEDGTVQGMLEMMDVPYVGAGVLGSAAGMDKDVMKRLARDAGIEIAPFLVVRDRHWLSDATACVENVKAWCTKHGWPAFVKPASLGSSVGISKVEGEDGVRKALEEAFRHDVKVVVEKGIDAREIECAVLGGHDPDAAEALGEVIPQGESFYSWEAKYIDAGASKTIVPAQVEKALAARIRAVAIRAFRALECWGLARVDFFVERGSDRIVFNEINTIPGFTSISMYAKMWQVSGVAYPVLIDRLIGLAMERRRTAT